MESYREGMSLSAVRCFGGTMATLRHVLSVRIICTGGLGIEQTIMRQMTKAENETNVSFPGTVK